LPAKAEHRQNTGRNAERAQGGAAAWPSTARWLAETGEPAPAQPARADGMRPGRGGSCPSWSWSQPPARAVVKPVGSQSRSASKTLLVVGWGQPSVQAQAGQMWGVAAIEQAPEVAPRDPVNVDRSSEADSDDGATPPRPAALRE